MSSTTSTPRNSFNLLEVLEFGAFLRQAKYCEVDADSPREILREIAGLGGEAVATANGNGNVPPWIPSLTPRHSGATGERFCTSYSWATTVAGVMSGTAVGGIQKWKDDDVHCR